MNQGQIRSAKGTHDRASIRPLSWAGRILYIALGVVLGVFAFFTLSKQPQATPYIAATAVAIVTAGVELLKKYSVGTPVRTLLGCYWAWVYLSVNALVAALALMILQDEGVIGVDAGKGVQFGHSPMLMALAAGFGAMMVLRSSFITIRTHGRDYPVGPALLLDALQDQIEHRIDQVRAKKSFKEVSELMKGVRSATCVEVATLALHVLERLSPETQSALRAEINHLRADEELSDANKSIAIGISIRKVAGFEVLQEVVDVVATKVKEDLADQAAEGRHGESDNETQLHDEARQLKEKFSRMGSETGSER